MSGLAISFEPQTITFSTDTLVTSNDDFSENHVNSQSKTDYYPHLRCCVVALGYTRLGNDYYDFINSLVLSEMVDLVEITEKYFLSYIDVDKYNPDVYASREEKGHLGALYIMGYSLQLKKLCAYRICVDREEITVTEFKEDTEWFIHPPVAKEEQLRIVDSFKHRTDVKPPEITIALLKQMAADTLDKEKYTVAVGMEIHTTQLSDMGGDYMCAFGIPVRLEGFEEQVKEMARGQEARLLAKKYRKELDQFDKLRIAIEPGITEAERDKIEESLKRLGVLKTQLDEEVEKLKSELQK